MSTPHLFLDSSALVAGAISADGAARALLVLAEAGRIQLTISEQVVAETERALARTAPSALGYYREALLHSDLRVMHDPAPDQVEARAGLIGHQADVPIELAAMEAGVDFLVTLNRRHFLDDPGVAERSGLRLGTPGDALSWVRQQLADSSATS